MQNQRTHGYSIDTLVRTTEGNGIKKIGDLLPGDMLLDENNNPVECIAVGEVEKGNLKILQYLEFSGSEPVLIKCTENQTLYLKAAACEPRRKSTTGRTRNYISIVWYTRCDKLHQELAIPEDMANTMNELHLTQLIERKKRVLRDHNCTNKLFKSKSQNVANNEMANFWISLLKSEDHGFIDPNVVREGDDFFVTVDEYENDKCAKESGIFNGFIKINRLQEFIQNTSLTNKNRRPFTVTGTEVGLFKQITVAGNHLFQLHDSLIVHD